MMNENTRYSAGNLHTEKARPGELRRGACGMAHHLLLKNASTEELVMREADHLAEQHPQCDFALKLDGIAGFTLFADGKTVCAGDFYQVEQMYRQDAFVFRGWLEAQYRAAAGEGQAQ